MSGAAVDFHAPVFHHRLGVALQFVDAFTGQVVRSPLRVRFPALGLEAIRAADDTYRLIVPDPPLPPPPPALFDVDVQGDDYALFEGPLQVELPRSPSAPPPVLRSDYLVRAQLWPTARVRTPAGETAVRGQVTRTTPAAPVAGLTVMLHLASENPALVPFTRTDALGQFLYRLSRLQGALTGGTPPATASLSVKMFDPAGPPLVPSPATITLDLGRASTLQFSVP
jgi:hypothetical protein